MNNLDKDELVLETIKDIEYIVNLVNGTVTTELHNQRLVGPYKYCRNLVEADLYSLNILRQNVEESRVKSDNDTTPEFMSRQFLGSPQSVETIKIIPTMKWLQKTFPERLI